MKWDKPTGAVQYSSNRAYCVVQANSQNWIAYQMGITTAEDLGTTDTDERARALCEERENRSESARRKA